MIQKKDIETREDIALLVNSFYGSVMEDNKIQKYFTGVVPFSLETHIPIMIDFWQSVLFATGGYTGNVIKKHIVLDEKLKLEQQHFDRWLSLWEATIEKFFAGKKADEALKKARSMAALMMFKIEAGQKPGFIQ